MPRGTRVAIRTDDVPAGTNLGVNTIPEIVDAETPVQIVTGPQAMSKADNEKFMNELVTIMIEESDNPDDPIFIPVGNGGDMQYIQRGVAQTVRRKYFYSLLAAKKVALSSSYGVDNKEAYNKLNTSAKSTHRVALMEDKNPLAGPRWVMEVMAGRV